MFQQDGVAKSERVAGQKFLEPEARLTVNFIAHSRHNGGWNLNGHKLQGT